jgi:hypothetical protein
MALPEGAYHPGGITGIVLSSLNPRRKVLNISFYMLLSFVVINWVKSTPVRHLFFYIGKGNFRPGTLL